MRVRAPSRVRDFRSYERGRRPSLGPGLTVDLRAQRRRQDEPARGALLRLHRAARAGPPTSARWCASARRRRASWSTPRPRTARTSWRSGFAPGEPKRMRVDGATVERLLDVARAPAGQRVPARPAGADQGRAGAAPRAPGPVRGRAVAGARGDAAGLRPGAGPAQRADRPDPRRARARVRRWRSWDAQLARHGIALMADRAAGGRADRRAVSPDLRASSGSTASRRSPTARARAPTTAEELARRARPSGVDSDLERGFTGHGPHRDDLVARSARAASCGPTAPRASSGSALLALLLAEREAIAERRERAAADAARRRDERARPRPPPGAGRAAAAERRPVGDHHHRPRARPRAPSERRRRRRLASRRRSQVAATEARRR